MTLLRKFLCFDVFYIVNLVKVLILYRLAEGDVVYLYF